MSSLEQRIEAKEVKPLDPDDQLAVAKAVRELLRDPAHWTRGAYHRGGSDIKTSNQFCLLGARMKVAGIDCEQDERFAKFLGFSLAGIVIGFNDRSTHTEVIKLLDKAIERGEVDRAG